MEIYDNVSNVDVCLNICTVVKLELSTLLLLLRAMFLPDDCGSN